jgi:hypothetical protein
MAELGLAQPSSKMICAARLILNGTVENIWLSSQDYNGRLSSNVLVNELIGDLKTFGERINQIVQLDMEIRKFDSILIANFWSVKTHLFEKENI